MTLLQQVSTDDAKEVVLGLGKALNDENFQIARGFVSDDMKYIGPFGVRDGAEAYLHEIQRLRLKFGIRKVFVDDQDVCAFYDIAVSGIVVFACGWFHVKGGKVSSLRVTFDPRPLLAASDTTRSLGS
jgi:hypothetical protein